MDTSGLYPNKQGGGAPRDIPGPGSRRSSYQYFFLQMAVPFTSTLSEAVSAITEVKDFDLMARGATSELTLFDRIQLIDQDHDWRLGSGFQPLTGWVGQTTRNEIYQWWRRPYFLPRRSTLTANLLNNAISADAAGNICIICERVDSRQEHLIPDNCRSYVLSANWTWNGVANSTLSPATPAFDRDFLIYGATYSGFAGPNTVRVIDQARDKMWSTNPLRFEYFFGLNANSQPILWYPCPYFLPRNAKLQFDVVNFGRTITGATNANPIVVTFSAPHGFQATDLVTITGVVGNTAANVANQAITVPSATTISLTGVAGNGAYVSGGLAALGTRTDFIDLIGITLN